MIRRNWKKLVLIFFSALLLFASVGLPYLLAVLVTRAGTRPMDLALTSSPADYDLDFEDVTFPAKDGVFISGWYLGGGNRKAVVACGHGLFRSRREVLDRAAFLRQQGYDTLVFDFRRHGTSLGERVTLGYQERLDFDGAVSFLGDRRPGAPVVLYGVSMGAAAAILSAGETPQVAAIIADSPFSSIEHTVVHHVKLILGLPRVPFASALLWFLEVRGGFDRAEFDVEKAAATLGERPLLVVAGAKDTRMPPDLQRLIYEASPSPKSRFEVFEGAKHGAAYRGDEERYQRLLMEFLSAADLTGEREYR